MGFGVVLVVFSLVGFECATAFRTEAKNPRAEI
jgi:amino acid transporter